MLSSTEPPDVPPTEFRLSFVGATPDLGHVAVVSPAALAANAIERENKENLYEWDSAAGSLRTVSILPNGTPDTEHGFLLGSGGDGGTADHAISDNGSRVIWTGAPPPSLPGSGLYVREGVGSGHAEETLQVDAAQGEPPGSSHGGVFLTANDDGSKIFFADRHPLTADPTASSGGLGDLYKFEPERPEGERLTDLTVDEAGTGVQGVLGASGDGSYLYFVANGVLAEGASQGNCSAPESPPGATCNLYLWHEGETRFIATLAGNDEGASNAPALGAAFDWESNVALRTARVSGDGTRLLFMSQQSLTGYDNAISIGGSCGRDANNTPLSAQCEEVFLYEANKGSLVCVSCNPSGARPVGASGIPAATPFAAGRASYQSRLLNEEGPESRVFFDSADALVPQDTNGQEDVYEYEDGHVYLLSSGTSTASAKFVDASASGDDVFFITRAQLVAQDTDQLVDLYDARAPHMPGEGVGFPAPVPPAVCESEGCKPAIFSAPVLTTFSSGTFTGTGNAVPSEESKPVVKPKSKKVKKKVRPKPKKAKRGRKSRSSKARRGVKGTRG